MFVIVFDDAGLDFIEAFFDDVLFIVTFFTFLVRLLLESLLFLFSHHSLVVFEGSWQPPTGIYPNILMPS